MEKSYTKKKGKEKEMFVHTEETTSKFNELLHDYQKIDSDEALAKRNLSYDVYNNMGLMIDTLRYSGQVTITDERLSEYFKGFRCEIIPEENGYLVRL